MKAPLGISYEIRLHSALMLPLLVNFSYIRLHSACMLPLLGNFFYIRLDSARMLPLLVNFSYIRLHSARMLPLLVNFSYIRLHSVLMLPLLVNFSYIRLHSARMLPCLCILLAYFASSGHFFTNHIKDLDSLLSSFLLILMIGSSQAHKRPTQVLYLKSIIKNPIFH